MKKLKFYSILTIIVPFLFLHFCGDPVVKVSKLVEREIYPDMIGVNGNLTQFDRPWNKDELVASMATLGISNVRYPAGTLGNYWDWDTGWLDTSVPDSLMIKWVVKHGLKESKKEYTLENFAKGQKKLKFTPIFMLNMLSKDLDHSVRNLLKAKKLGLPIKYIELGNEFFFNLPYESSVYPTPEDYGKTCQIWIDSLKHHFPDAKYSIIGSYLKRDSRQTNWTSRALKYCKNADAVTFHKYSPAGADGRMEKINISAGTEGMADLMTATRKAPSEDSKEKQLWEMKLLTNDTTYANFLQSAKRAALCYHDLDAPKDMDIWATEFNMRDDESPLRGTWANAFYTAKYYDMFLQGPITLTNIHNAIGNLFPQVFSSTDQMNHVLWKKVKSIPWQLSSQGIATSMYANASKSMLKASQLTFTENPIIKDDRGNIIETLSGWQFSSNSSSQILLINYGRDAVTLDLSDLDEFKFVYTFKAPADAYITSGFKDVNTSVDAYTYEPVLPPFSFTLLK